MIPQVSAILRSMSVVLVILAIKTLIMPHNISCYLIRPFEERPVFNLFQDLLYWFSEHSINHLGVGRSRLPNKVFPRSVIIVSVQLEIPHLLKDHLSLSSPLQLVFFYPFVLVNPFHKLVHTDNKLTSQRFPQIMLVWEASFRSINGHIIIVFVYFVKHFPVSIRIGLKSLLLPHGHR